MVKSNKVRYCFRCGYHWKPSTKQRPRTCPKCSSRNWNIPRFYENAEKGMMAW